jgi:lysophospholipase L1-like esterase
MEVLNKGINGDTTGGMLARFSSDVINSKPSHVIIMGGVNDLIWNVPLSVVESNVAAIIQQSVHNLIVPVIGVPTPVIIDEAQKHWGFVSNFYEVNEMLRDYRQWIVSFGEYFGVKVLDFYKLFYEDYSHRIKRSYFLDGLHPTIEGNEIMCSLVMSILK